MTAPAVYDGGGALFKQGSTTLGGVTKIDLSGYQVSEIDTVNLASTVKTTRPGMVDPGSITVSYQYDPGDSPQTAIVTALNAKTIDTYHIVFPDSGATDISATGYVKSFKVTAENDKNMEAEAEIRLTAVLASS